jgi:predicted glycogen debranching enzyme
VRFTSANGLAETREWLEADGLGGFAMGTATGLRTRRYHAVLLAATTPPTGRMALVQGVEAWVTTPSGRFALTSHRYAPDVVHPDGARRIESFESEPWPTWTYRLENGTRISHELFMARDLPLTVLTWRVLSGADEVHLSLRPLLSGRDSHALHHQNGAFRFAGSRSGDHVRWQPYDGVPAVVAASNGCWTEAPDWYRNFLYAEERDRGLDCIEDLASPGLFEWTLGHEDAVCVFAQDTPDVRAVLARGIAAAAAELRSAERRRRTMVARLERAAADYVVRRGDGRTVVAGYPWFTDWGRDTFIAMRGLCLATGHLDDARDILLEWSGAVSRGMLPNRFVDGDEPPEYNSVDASLWYIVAVHDYLRECERTGRPLEVQDRGRLCRAVRDILEGYAAGTRYGIRMDDDGLLAAGEPGLQLTWMDAKVGDWVVTPRMGKPVDVQALWLNALTVGCEISTAWSDVLHRARVAFENRFWNESGGYLYDVVDVDHVPGTADPAFRPNQLFAIGGLPFQLLHGERARRVVDAVEAQLWTPLGPRSLAPGSPAYKGRYLGGVRDRDGAYHQGTVWPWLAGAFIEAWVRVRGATALACAEARERFLGPLLAHRGESGLGHLPEIADGDAPHAARGCPFQAWSAGEALRLEKLLLAVEHDAVRTAR